MKMGLGLHDRLLRRELGGCTRYSKVRGLYGDQTWVDGLDIVNELDGHTGCVNALRFAHLRAWNRTCSNAEQLVKVRELACLWLR